MTLPVSTIFDTADWNPRYATTPGGADVAITDGTYGFLTYSDTSTNASYWSEALLLRANGTNKIGSGPALASVRVVESITATFTFEFDVSFPGDLPAGFEDLDDRVFIGAVASTWYTAGFLVSRAGLAVAASPYSPTSEIVPLQGSARHLFNSDGSPKESITVRAVVDSDIPRCMIYIGDTSDVYDEDYVYGAHKLVYSIPAKVSTLPADQILLAVRAKPSTASDYKVLVTSLRVNAAIVESPARPTAVIPFVDAITVGRRFALDGRGSSSPIDAALTYQWEVEEAPEGSTAILTGGIYSSVTVGAAPTNDGVVFKHVFPSEYSDGAKITIYKATDGQPILLTKNSATDVSIRLETTSAGAAVTTASGLIEAITSTGSPFYNADVAKIITAEALAGSNGTGIVDLGTYFTSGGKGSVYARTSFVPDKSGIYRFSLWVKDTYRISEPALLTVAASLSTQLLGHRPNTDYIWASLSDFWNKVSDKAKISVAWSSFAQVVSDDLMRLLQADYSKSIKDISRKYQRRWLSYKLRVDVPDYLHDSLVRVGSTHLFVKPSDAYVGTNTDTSTFSTVVRSGEIVDPNTGAAVTYVPPIVDSAPCVVINFNGSTGKTLIKDQSASGNGKVSFSTDAIDAFKIIDSGNYLVVEPAKVVKNVGGNLKIANIAVDDVLVINRDGVISARQVDSTTVISGSDVQYNQLLLKGAALPASAVKYPWQIVRHVPYCQVVQTAYFNLGTDVDLRYMEIQYGDSAEVEYEHPVTHERLVTAVPIILSTTNEIFVDWRPLVDSVNAASKALFLAGSSLLTGAKVAPVYSLDSGSVLFDKIKLLAVLRTSRIPVREDTISIPELGTSTVVAEFYENRDYSLADKALNIADLHSGRVLISKGASSLVFVDPLPAGISTSAMFLLEGELGVFAVTGVNSEGTAGTALNKFNVSGTFNAVFPRYSFNTNVPDQLWAEVTYFNNYDAIENNFGVVAGLPKSLLDDNNIDVDYLSLVKSVWFAFWHGPSLYNIKLASQSFLGLPFSEVDGQVTVIKPDESADLGKIILKEIDRPGYHTYFYPNVYDIALNPLTNRQIKARSLEQAAADFLTRTEQKELTRVIDSGTLSDKDLFAAEDKLARAQAIDDSRIPAYTSFVDAVEVYDYVSNSDLINSVFTGSKLLEKFHTFIIQIPTRELGSLTFLPVLKSFVSEWKPAHTSFLFYGLMEQSETISITDEVTFDMVLEIDDTLYSSPVSPADAYRAWPADRTLENNPDVPLWDETDILDKYESGYVSGKLDDYSGDASWNSAHSRLDPVNTLDSDIDVLASYIWLSVETLVGVNEFIKGEPLELVINGAVIPGIGWDSDDSLGRPGAPPVLDFIEAGFHPRLPFGISSPQNDHAHTYIRLGFSSNTADVNYGSVYRLSALEYISIYGAAADYPKVKIRGMTSTAEGVVVPVSGTNVYPSLTIAADDTDPAYADHEKLFDLCNYFDLDLIHDKGPRTVFTMTPMMYIPVGGTAPPVVPADLPEQTPFIVDDKAIQKYPDLAIPMVPSYSPGFYVSSFIGNYKWGYDDQGDVSAIPPGPWVSSTVDLENVHMGRTVCSDKGRHYTHGFVNFVDPAPVLVVAWNAGANLITCEGHYFLNDDATRVTVPTDDPASFDGDVGCSWVFLRDVLTGIEYPADDPPTFITGQILFSFILQRDGNVQTHTGHHIDATFATAPVPGTYDVIIRNYRPYDIGGTGYNRVSESVYSTVALV